ncbi:MAG: Holliday junction branch migration protein RuvA [Porticoccaceae bacterium]
MIGSIRGILLEKQAPELLIDVQGLGYEVKVSLNTFFELPESGKEISLYTHFVVREDVQQLYGFDDVAERHLFRALIKVNGVGPKMALAVLSGMTVANFVTCVQTGDTAELIKLPGVGKKTAERLLIEMRDTLGGSTPRDQATWNRNITQPGIADIVQEAESALTSLGYKPQDAAKMINASIKDQDLSQLTSESLIRLTLKSMVKK